MEEVVNKIIEINEDNELFWSKSYGWAPSDAADLLSISRLDWQTSLSHTLKLWIDESLLSNDNMDGSLILAWTNLGALVEGTMKLLLCVYYLDYKDDEDAIKIYDRKQKERIVAEPDSAKLDLMREFYKKRIWTEGQEHWNEWVLVVQQRRNAVHEFKTREIGDFGEFHKNVRRYLEFLQLITERLPRP
ncbi:hypothetical protein [Paenibacillus sp. DMB20]|uniref:hypothetical protein n=1 Tax=Paenibacillus sp. DMB20 TaxID=1642570 RepID=UPI001910B414|nr:hypothetical protein [Paenibacillus sp. DMB20]